MRRTGVLAAALLGLLLAALPGCERRRGNRVIGGDEDPYGGNDRYGPYGSDRGKDPYGGSRRTPRYEEPPPARESPAEEPASPDGTPPSDE